MKDPALAFIGFGDIARIFSKALAENGLADIRIYVRTPRDTGGFSSSTDMAEVFAGRDIIYAAVTPGAALDVAKEASKFLAPGQIYIDNASVAPATKIEMASIINATGARFVEAAQFGNANKYGLSAPIHLCGEAAPDVIAALSPFGMDLTNLGLDYGRAAASKMFRSILGKGLEALMQECVRGADHYGAADDVLDFFGEGFYKGIDWKMLADHFVVRTAVHGMRRAEELDEVAAMMRDLGEEPFMTEAAAKRLRSLASPEMKARFADNQQAGFHEVLDALKKR